MRLLVVEDEAETAVLMHRGLNEEGYSVDVATDGREGLWLAQQNDYDVIVLDATLPGLDGYEVCRRLRGAARLVPVLMLAPTGPAAGPGQGVGASDYLAKPFALGELAARVSALVRRAHPGRSPVLTVGDLVLDPNAGTVSRAGRPIVLTGREFALLELFMRHPGEVLTRAKILERVWDFSFDSTSNVVDQYVGYLRRKVDRPWGRRGLRAVRGIGYRLDPTWPPGEAPR